MSSKNITKKNKSIIPTKPDRLQMLPIILIIAFIPLIVLFKKIKTHLNNYNWYSSETTKIDCFLYYKMIFIIITGIFMVLLLSYHYCMKGKKSISIPKSFISLAIFGVFSLLSTLLSPYRKFGMTGVPDQMESIFVVLCYCIICFYCYTLTQHETNLRYLIKYLKISIVILCLLGILQLTGHDFFTSSLGNAILTSTASAKYRISLNFGNMVYLTFFNPNYVGSYCSLLIPFLFALLLESKKRKEQILYILLLVGLTICLLGSKSTSGFAALCITCIFLLIFFRRNIFTNKVIAISALASFIVVLMGICIKFDVPSRIHNISNHELPMLSRIDTRDDCVTITYGGEQLNISYTVESDDNFSFRCTDHTGADIPLSFSTVDNITNLTLQDSRFSSIYIQPVKYINNYIMNVIIDNNSWYFTNQTEDGSYYYLNAFGKPIKINSDSQNSLPEKYYSLGSGRIYIWSKTIPLIKKHLLTGCGSDAFIFEFPNDDYVGLYNYGFKNQLMSKPHNMYLQIAVQNGLVALLAFLCFYLIYFIQSIRLYFKRKAECYMDFVGIGIFIGSVGYMVSCCFNDSSITVAPIFWAFLGIGFFINQNRRKDYGNEN